jgi:hypothetical protein
MSEYTLIDEIISRSQSKKWDNPKAEWKLAEVIESEVPETCLCGHYPIIELCELVNTKNGNSVIVGNHCVKKFMNISSDKVFLAIKRVRANIEKSANLDTIAFLHEKGIVTDWERAFYENTWRKRSLTPLQLDKRIQINEKILLLVKKRGI